MKPISGIIDGAGNSNDLKKYDFLDRNVHGGTTYYYQIEDIDLSGITIRHKIISVTYLDQKQDGQPKFYQISPSYPNPFGGDSSLPSTSVQISIPAQKRYANFKACIVNILGQEIYTFKSESIRPGEHILTWFGTDQYGNRMSNGTYFWYFNSDGVDEVRRILLLR